MFDENVADVYGREMEMFRHGGQYHFMRPDQVYRTSVLQPMVGYAPQADVMSVTQQFTTGPFLATTANGIAGFGGLRGPGPLQRLGLRIRAAFAARRARKFMSATGVTGFGISQMRALNGLGYDNFGPAYAMGIQVAPQNHGAMQRVLMLTANQSDVPVGSSDALVNRRLSAYYR